MTSCCSPSRTCSVLADSADLEFFRRRLPRTWLGAVRHGMIGKRGPERLPPRERARRFDFLCVDEGFWPDQYKRANAEPGAYSVATLMEALGPAIAAPASLDVVVVAA